MRVLCIHSDDREYGAYILEGGIYHVAEEQTCRKCGQGYFGLEEHPREKYSNRVGPWMPNPRCRCGGPMPIPNYIMWRKEYFKPLDGEALNITLEEVKELYTPKEVVHGN